MTPEEAADLAARTLAVIPERQPWPSSTSAHHAADRERVASDLAGLRLLDGVLGAYVEQLRSLFADGLRRTGRLYGVES